MVVFQSGNAPTRLASASVVNTFGSRKDRLRPGLSSNFAINVEQQNPVCQMKFNGVRGNDMGTARNSSSMGISATGRPSRFQRLSRNACAASASRPVWTNLKTPPSPSRSQRNQRGSASTRANVLLICGALFNVDLG